NTQLQKDNDCTEKMVWLETTYHGHPAPDQNVVRLPIGFPIDKPYTRFVFDNQINVACERQVQLNNFR
ncbi:hypothetical protein, partial [Caldalkalibacillus thermarum]|uniref:hypothetical protein n=1 Tax=Caldalkalibacillus thermarum TaxID=296745 RepID=UPI001E2F4E1B